MSVVLTCAGPIFTVVGDQVTCRDAQGTILPVQFEVVTDPLLTQADFDQLWPPLVLMMVSGFIIKMLISTVSQGAGRN